MMILDDNSPDGTARVAAGVGARLGNVSVLLRKGPRGFGPSYLDGFREALKRNMDAVIMMDADLSHDPKYLPQFLEALKTHEVAVGSRYVSGGGLENWPGPRRWLSRWANRYARAVVGLPVRDCTAGFMAIKKEILERLPLERIHTNGYSFLIELKYWCHHLGARILEIPILFVDRRAGQSKISRRIIWEAAFLVWRLRFQRVD